MTEDNKALLDAVTAGIESAGDSPAASESKEPVSNETDESGSDGVGTTDGDGTVAKGVEGGDVEGVSGDGEAPGTEGKDGDSKEGEGADGTGKPKEGEAGKAAAAEGAALPKVDPVKERNAAINDPVDQRLKESTRNRITFLANEVKRQDSALENANQLFDAIDSTGMGPDELATMLGYARVRHNGTPDEKKKALSFLKEEIRALAVEVGEVDAVDLLSEHADLQDAIANNTITEAHARELALARARTKRADDDTAATSAQTTAQRAHAAGVQAINDTATALYARDGAAVFMAKKGVITATLKPVLAELPPSKWAGAFQRAYDALPVPAATAAPPPPVPPKVPAKPTPQPLRPGTPAGGGGQKAPQSMKDAVFAAFDTTE